MCLLHHQARSDSASGLVLLSRMLRQPPCLGDALGSVANPGSKLQQATDRSIFSFFFLTHLLHSERVRRSDELISCCLIYRSSQPHAPHQAYRGIHTLLLPTAKETKSSARLRKTLFCLFHSSVLMTSFVAVFRSLPTCRSNALGSPAMFGGFSGFLGINWFSCEYSSGFWRCLED